MNPPSSVLRFTVNQALGVLEVRDESGLRELAPALEAASASSETRLFDRVKDTDLARLGVDVSVLPLMRAKVMTLLTLSPLMLPAHVLLPALLVVNSDGPLVEVIVPPALGTVDRLHDPVDAGGPDLDDAERGILVGHR